MRKRLSIGLLSAVLLAVMLPGVAGAKPDFVYVCHFDDHVNSDFPNDGSGYLNDFMWYVGTQPGLVTWCRDKDNAKLFRYPYAVAIKLHPKNFPGE